MVYSIFFCIFAAEGSEYGLRLGNLSELDCTRLAPSLPPRTTTLHVRKAIELLRGVVSTTVFKTKDESNKKTLRQQAYVKESLERAFDEMKQARREGRKLQSADDFINELEAEEAV